MSARADQAFVTGGTGFIGRHLIERLLERPGRKVFVLVRKHSLPRFEERRARWHAEAGRVVPIVGDLTAPRLGLSSRQLADLRGQIGHCFHGAGLYDMAASDEALQATNVTGTQHAVAAAELR